MPHSRLSLVSLALLAACQATTPSAPPSEEAMMEAMVAFATPGPAHARLGTHVGRWNAAVRMYMAPGQPPEESAAQSEVRWIMDGRYIEETVESTFMGQPFQGRGVTGYDNMKGCYVGFWIDTMGTSIAHSTGHYDEPTRTFTFTMKMPDPVAGREVTQRMTERWIDDDHFVVQSFNAGPDGKELLGMEIDYTRVR
jgi:hypothetical protein